MFALRMIIRDGEVIGFWGDGVGGLCAATMGDAGDVAKDSLRASAGAFR